jgi:hypothetical protein
MANCRSSLGLVHFVVDVTNEKELREALIDCISMDNDLTENEEYFREDTLDLGFENETERIVSEALEGDVDLSTLEGVTDLFSKVTDSISDQEFFGVCGLDVIELGYNKFVVAFVYGGDYGN